MSDDEVLAQFRILFPEFDESDDERVKLFISLARNRINKAAWGKQYNEALLYLTAHLLAMRYGSNGNGSPVTSTSQEVTSKSIGKISVGLSSSNSDAYVGAGDYALTPYGRYYWELLQLVMPVVRVFTGGGGGCGCSGGGNSLLW